MTEPRLRRAGGPRSGLPRWRLSAAAAHRARSLGAYARPLQRRRRIQPGSLSSRSSTPRTRTPRGSSPTRGAAGRGARAPLSLEPFPGLPERVRRPRLRRPRAPPLRIAPVPGCPTIRAAIRAIRSRLSERIYTPNGAADRSYNESLQNREAIYSQYLRESDPKRRGAALSPIHAGEPVPDGAANCPSGWLSANRGRRVRAARLPRARERARGAPRTNPLDPDASPG